MFQNFADSFRNIVLAEPEQLGLIGLVPALFLLFIVLWLFKVWRRPKQTHGSRYPILGTFKFWTALIFVLILAVWVLANPFIPKGNFVIKKGSVEAIFLVDYSSSMFLKDTGTARINLAAREIMSLLPAQVIAEGDRVSLFVFGNGSLRRLPLTKDLNLFANEIDLVGQPNTLLGDDLYWGSDIISAFERIYMLLDRQDMIAQFGKEVDNWQPKPKQNRMIFVFTDGADLLKFSDDKKTDDSNFTKLSTVIGGLNKRNLKVYPIGIGTKNGALLTEILGDYKKQTEYDPRLEEDLKDQVSRLNVPGLEYLKNATRSSIGPFLIENDGISAINFMRLAMDQHRSKTIEPALTKEKEELFQYFLMAALAVFIVGMLITKF